MTTRELRRLQRLARTVGTKAFTLAKELQQVLGDEFHTHDLGINAGDAALAAHETERLLERWNSGEGG